jgi:hypothetical protein
MFKILMQLYTVKHSSRKAIKIYVVTQENKVDIVFDNKKEDIEAKRSEVSIWMIHLTFYYSRFGLC